VRRSPHHHRPSHCTSRVSSSSWGAYEPSSLGGGPNRRGSGNHGGVGGGYNDSSRQAQVQNGRRSDQRRHDDDQDAAWAKYDLVHGNDHPNNADFRRPGRGNNDIRQSNSNGQNRGHRREHSRSRDGWPRSNDVRNEDGPINRPHSPDGNLSSGNAFRKPNYAFSNNTRKSNVGGNGNNDGRNNGENNFSRSAYAKTPPMRENRQGGGNSMVVSGGGGSNGGINNSRTRRSNNASGLRQQLHSHDRGQSFSSGNSKGKLQLRVLYTHQKTKKKKSWKDGRLVLCGTNGSLYEARPNAGGGGGTVDTLELNGPEARALLDGRYEGELESEKFLIQVEGPWTETSNHDTLFTMGRPRTVQPSAKMKKLLTKKFVVPAKVRPLHPEEKRHRDWSDSNMSKRARPLQPGELERRHYGGGRNDDDGHGYYGGHRGGDDQGNGGNGRNYGGNGQRCGNDDRYNDGGRCHGNDGGYEEGEGYHRNNYGGDVQGRNSGQNPYGVEGGRRNDSARQTPHRRDNPSDDSRRSSFDHGSRADGGQHGRGNDDGRAGNRFQEYDASGFYEEQDEDSDDEDDNRIIDNGRADNSDGDEYLEQRGNERDTFRAGDGAEKRIDRYDGRGNDLGHNGRTLSRQQRESGVQDQCDSRHGDGMIKPNDHQISEGKEEHNFNETEDRTGPQTDHHHAATDDLLALLGAAPPAQSASPEKKSPVESQCREKESCPGGGQKRCDAARQSDDDGGADNDGEEESSFLAGILEAEEQVNNRGITTSGVVGGFGRGCEEEDEDFGDDDDGGDDDFDQEENEDLGINVDIDNNHDTGNEINERRGEGQNYQHGGTEADAGEGEMNSNVSGFTLPSADESSSSEEEDE